MIGQVVVVGRPYLRPRRRWPRIVRRWSKDTLLWNLSTLAFGPFASEFAPALQTPASDELRASC